MGLCQLRSGHRPKARLIIDAFNTEWQGKTKVQSLYVGIGLSWDRVWTMALEDYHRWRELLSNV